jgi:hypothetical protein
VPFGAVWCRFVPFGAVSCRLVPFDAPRIADSLPPPFGGRRYIVGTPKGMLKKFQRHLLSEDWQEIREGLEVQLVPSPGNICQRQSST